jgi:pimeloyl-ACP methyl ester carboxylesterase
VWDDVTPLLVEAGLEVIRYDCRGHGESGGGGQAPTLNRLAADLNVVLDHLALERVVLLGHSMGGATILQHAVAQQAAGQHGDQNQDSRVAALVITASSAAFIQPAWLQPAARFFGWIQGTKIATRLMDGRAGYWFIRPVLGASPPAGTVEATLESYRQTPAPVISRQFRLLTRVDIIDQLHHIDVPATVLFGGRDTLTPPAHSKRMASALADSVIEGFPGAGHMLPYERPAEVADHIVRLTRRVDLPADEVDPAG